MCESPEDAFDNSPNGFSLLKTNPIVATSGIDRTSVGIGPDSPSAAEATRPQGLKAILSFNEASRAKDGSTSTCVLKRPPSEHRGAIPAGRDRAPIPTGTRQRRRSRFKFWHADTGAERMGLRTKKKATPNSMEKRVFPKNRFGLPPQLAIGEEGSPRESGEQIK